MNFYDFHLGDYAKHTKHLTLTEDLAYRRMLDLYYTTEQPLPLEPGKIARLIGMRDYIKDVSENLSDFFVKSEKGWVNERCEREISAYTEKANRARKANKARWGAKSDLKSDTKSDPSGSEIRNDSDPPIPIPIPIPNKSFSPKKKKTGWPKNFELTEERKIKAETYWKKNGVSFDVQLKWDGFKSTHTSKGSMFKDWDDAWETWYIKAVEFSSNGNGNGNGHTGKQRDGSIKVAL